MSDERIERVLAQMEQPSMIGPALAEMGDDEHAVWQRGWDAAVRFLRAHLTADTEAKHGN